MHPPTLPRALSIVAVTFVIAIGMFVPARHLHAQTTRLFYVSPGGSDSNPGTELQPFLTLQRAADVVNAGDTVVVENGVYTGIGSGTACASISRPVVCLSRGGASGSPVTIKARHVGGAKVDGRNNTSTDGFRFLANANYITLEGFEIYGMGNATGSSSGIELFNGGHDVVIAHNDLHDIGRLCTDTTNGEVGIFIEQPRVRVEGNRLHDIGRFAPGENGCAPATAYYKNHDHGIYVDGSASGTIPGASDTFIANNLLYNHGRGWAIHVYPGTVDGLRILNNTFAFPNPYQDGHIILGANISDAQIINNIFYQPRTAAINYYTGTLVNLQITQNLVSNAKLLNTILSGTLVVGNQVANPLLTQTATPPYDFHLMSGSPAIDVGLTLVEVPLDFDGVPRIAYDIGAYEAPNNASGTAATPTITPNGGTFTGPVTVTLATSTIGATIRYTTDGTAPGASSPIYGAPFSVTTSGSVKAKAIASGMNDSVVAEATFQIQSVPPPPSDTMAPTVWITAPHQGDGVFRRTAIVASASDDVGVANVRFEVDRQTIAVDSSAPYSTWFNFRKTAAGSHEIRVIATDAAGKSAEATITITVLR
jgi:hypothetical protein